MTLLLDTHTLLWASLHPEELSQTALNLIADVANTFLVSLRRFGNRDKGAPG